MWKRLSYIAFLASILLLVILSTGGRTVTLGEYYIVLIWGFILFGLLGFSFSFVAIFQQESLFRTRQIVFQLGLIFIYLDFVTKLQHYPRVPYLLVIGFVVIFSSYFIKKDTPKKDDELLDD